MALPQTLPQFDEVYAVSDLHMGGDGAGRQIFDSGKELAAFIDSLSVKAAGKVAQKKIALVINGDFVDFLAEPDAKAFDPVGAVGKLERIAGDAAFKPVFDALTKYLADPAHKLAITLGNHDLELSLPWVRERLVQLLAGDDDARVGRISLALDGAGFLCRVGNASVLCVHGNEADDWNFADHEKIRRIGRDIQQGQEPEAWTPNAGSRLVVEVMNDVKKSYPFVDLLKPELSAVMPVLWAVAPEKRQKIYGLLPVLSKLARDSVLRGVGLLGETRVLTEISPDDARMPGVARRMDAKTLLDQTEKKLRQGDKPTDLLPARATERQLGRIDAIRNWIVGGDKRETLRQELESLQKDRSFAWNEQDDTFHAYNRALDMSIDFVVTGHTHLHRALQRDKGKFYFNSGTWARLMRFDKKMLRDSDAFTAAYQAIEGRTMEALDKADNLVMRARTVVAIRRQPDDSVRGELMDWDAKNGKLSLVHNDAVMVRR